MTVPPPPPAASPQRNPALLVVAGVLGLLAVFGRRTAPVVEVAPPPPGWLQIREPGAVLAMVIDGETVWVGGKLGLHLLDRRTGAWRGRVDLPRVSFVRALALTASGRLWIGHDAGLAFLDGQRHGTAAWPEPGPRRVNVLALDGDGTLLLGLADGLYRLDRDQVRRDGRSGRLVSPVVDALRLDPDGNLWCGSSSDRTGGVAVFRPDGNLAGVLRDELPHRYVNEFAAMPDGTVWIATGQGEAGGVAIARMVAGRPVVQRVLTLADGLAGAKARVVFADRSGARWVGSENDGLALLRPGGSLILREPDGLTHREVTCHVEDRDGHLWLGGLRGVTRLDAAAVKRLKSQKAAGA